MQIQPNNRLDKEELQLRIQVLIESLFEFIYDMEATQINLFESPAAKVTQNAYISSWIERLRAVPRSVSNQDNQIIEDIEKVCFFSISPFSTHISLTK